MSTALLRRRGVARVTGVLAACALAGTGVIASTSAAVAEEESVTETLQTFATEAFEAQADELPSGLVEAIERDLGLSPAEYLANAAAAKVAADVVADLEAAGVGINASVIAGQDVTIYVEAEADVAAAEAVGAEVEVGLPELDLDGTEEQEYYAQDDFKGGYGYAAVSPDETFLSRCSSGFNGTAANGDPVVYTAGHCGAEFPEGHPWYHIPLDGPIFDTDAWTGTETTPPPFLERPLGENGPMHFGAGEDGNDGGLLRITEPGWTTPPQVATWGGGTGAPDDGAAVNVYDSTDAIVGQPACKSGATSGWTCGEVLHVEDTVQLSTEETVTAFIFTACMLSGDSGGSIVSGNYALGVDSFSTAETTATCDETNWTPATVYDPEADAADGDIGGGFAVTSGSANAETLFDNGYSLGIHVGAPAVTEPEDGGTTGQTPTISGSVEAAEGATVTVEIDGGPTVEDTVAADGSWSAEVTEALEPGVYNYTATASHTANGAQEATTSGETTGSFEVAEGPEVEDLVVDSPTEGQTTDNPRPEFSGTGQPGATVALTVGESALGEAEVGEDGTWTITPSGDLPVGVRFDAVVTQTFEDDTQEATVAGLGISAPDVTIAAPEDGSTVAGDVVFEGTSFGGATIGLLLEQAADAASDDAQPRLGVRAEGDDVEEWAGEFDIDDAGNWTFDPAEDLPDGEYTVTATATLDGGDPELADSEAVATFTVATDDGGDAGGSEDGDDLPDTGSSNTTWLIVGGIALLVAGGAAVAIRARRNGTTA